MQMPFQQWMELDNSDSHTHDVPVCKLIMLFATSSAFLIRPQRKFLYNNTSMAINCDSEVMKLINETNIVTDQKYRQSAYLETAQFQYFYHHFFFLSDNMYVFNLSYEFFSFARIWVKNRSLRLKVRNLIFVSFCNL